MSQPFSIERFLNVRSASAPEFSPDGRFVAYVHRSADIMTDKARSSIWLINLATGEQRPIAAGTGDSFSPRWSPDGRYIAAMTVDQHKLMVFDRNTSKWAPLADGIIHNPVWSQDGKQLYFQQLQEYDVPIYRVSIGNGRLERICDRTVSNSTDSIEFWGLAPNGGPIGSFVFWSADIYSLDWKPGA